MYASLIPTLLAASLLTTQASETSSGVGWANTSAVPASELARFALDGFRDSRQRLRSGVFRVTGRREHWRITDIETLARETLQCEDFEQFCAFDFDRQLFRLDHLGTSAEPPRDEMPSGGKYVRTKDYSIHWIIGSRQANYFQPERRAIESMMIFDIRLVGFTNMGTLMFRDVDWEKWKQVVDSRGSRIRDAGMLGSLYNLAWFSPESRVGGVVSVDANQGFSPVRNELFLTDGKTGKIAVLEEMGVPPLREVHLATWMEKNGIWVPTSLAADIESYSTHVDRRTARRYELAFQWESVNEPLDEKLFDWAGMKLPEKTRVLDNRLGWPPIVVASVGQYVAPPPQPELPASSFGPGWRILLIVGLHAVAFVTLLYWGRRRRARRPSAPSGTSASP